MDRYSRMVAFLKVLLPLAALALLSTLFLISRGVNTETTIPFTDYEIEERMRGQQITAPFFSGTTSQGDEITVTASIARPGGPTSPAIATDLVAVISMADGGRLSLRSDSGEVLLDSDLARFTGNVEITSAVGLLVTSDLLNATISGLEVESPGPVQAVGPIGTLNAETMQLRTKTQGGPLHMLFNNGVKLVYDPRKSER